MGKVVYMGWFTKKKEVEEVPKLPELPSFSETSGFRMNMPESPPGLEEIEINSLPSLPEPERATQQEIKQAIKPEFRETISSPRTLEMVERPIQKQITKRLEPIYIRLDRFETASESFEDIKKKIEEIEDLLIKTKQIKAEEEKELEEWEREIQGIKARMDSIDKTLFSKLE